ncbi:terminase family protein [bacterium]|nr:terminase family protein [bacterium]
MSDGVGDNKWIPKGETDLDSERIVWSTKQINDLELALDQGYRPKIKLPFYEGRQYLRKGNVVFEYTDAEISELAKCATDIVYFAEKYAVVMTDNGIQKVKLRDYQKTMLRNFQDNRFNIVLASRQMGKTVTASIFNAWYLVFNTDKNTLLLANKSDSTKEIIDKAKVVIENLPFFMKPGIIKYDVMNVRCDNGCRLIGQSTTAKAGIGFTIHNLYLDEFAHIHPTIVDAFYENVYPTLSASAVSRITITSTPNGFNKFYLIYAAAERGDNEYKAQRIDWWEHPDRDDAWYERELGNLGTIDAFNRQYGNEFVSSSNLLLDPISVKKMRKRAGKYIHHELDEFDYINIDVKDCLEWDPTFDIDDCRNPEKFWLFSVDIAEGNGGDASVINIFELQPMNIKELEAVKNAGAMYDFFKFKQVARFKSNTHVIEDFAKILYTLSVDIFYNENVKMIVEYNTYGTVLFQYLRSVFPQKNDFDDEMIVRFKHRHDARTLKPGIKLKSDNKAIFCQNFSKLYTDNRIDITDEATVIEASLFGTLPNGSYGAQMGHDDIIMTAITATEFFNTTDYADFVEEVLDFVDEGLHAKMESILFKDNDSEGDLQYDIYDLLK